MNINSNQNIQQEEDKQQLDKSKQLTIAIPNDEDTNDNRGHDEGKGEREEEIEERANDEHSLNKHDNIINDLTKQIDLMQLKPSQQHPNQFITNSPLPYVNNQFNYPTHFNIPTPQSSNELDFNQGDNNHFTHNINTNEDEEPKPIKTPQQHTTFQFINASSPERHNSNDKNNFKANKAKTQQYKYNTRQGNEMESPIYSYNETNHKYLIESLFQNEETKKRSNFIKKQQQPPFPNQFDQLNDFNNNPLMNNMNYNFFNQNMMDNNNNNSNANTYATSPILNNNQVKSNSQYEDYGHYINNTNSNSNSNSNTLNVNSTTTNNNFNYFDMNNKGVGNNTTNQGNMKYKYKSYKGNKESSNNEYGNMFQHQQYQPETSDESNSNYLSSLYKNKEFFKFSLNDNNNNTGNSNHFNNNQFNFAQQKAQYESKQGNEEYIFEKFGKRGWQCEKCNNFNFESRTKCNRCDSPMQPKPLSKIRIEANTEEKKKKILIERKGDWSCIKCKNLNFAFRKECNRCGYPKQELLSENNQHQPMMPMGYKPYSFHNTNGNQANSGLNYIDYQNMINAFIYPNMTSMNPMAMNKMMYPNNNQMNPFTTMNQAGLHDRKPKRPYEKDMGSSSNQMHYDKLNGNNNNANNNDDNLDNDEEY